MLALALTAVLLIAELLNVAQIAEGVQVFKRCYNASLEETHCFDVQYDNDQPLHTSFQNAQLRCRGLNTSLVTIDRKEIDTLIQRFMADSNNPIRGQYIWLNAYQINTYSTNSNRWRWLNTTVSDIPGSAVTWTWNPSCYTAVLEFRYDNGIAQFYLTAKEPQMTFYYVCEYSESNCSSSSFNDGRLLINGRCYRAAKESVTWYEARNKCLNGGGDLASFANVSNVNFTSWLGPAYLSAYWIGLRFIWYTWGESGSDAMYTNWAKNAGSWNKPCLIWCASCDPLYTWSSEDCTGNRYVVCHAITTLQPTTTSTSETSTSTTSTALTSSGSKEPPSNSSLPPYQSSESISSTRLSLGIGVGVGVGVPLIVAVIVIVICIVLRKRRQRPTASSSQLNNNREEIESSSFDKTISDPTVKAKNEMETSTYGTVVPSTLSRQLAEASGANSKAEPAEYAPLQFL